MWTYANCIGTMAKLFTVVCRRLRHKISATAHGDGKRE
jgi:hypothetical protein